jgi:hypothetical protein
MRPLVALATNEQSRLLLLAVGSLDRTALMLLAGGAYRFSVHVRLTSIPHQCGSQVTASTRVPGNKKPATA